MNQAFILGAGLGTRLRPLTDRLPKPLVPLFHRPLAAWAMDACKRVGVTRFAVNTHHLPEAWNGFEDEEDVALFHEPELLDTGGGLKNIERWVRGASTLVHNGDIFSTMPLDRLVEAHERSGMPVTLALRSDGVAKHIALDATQERVVDVRDMLGVSDGTHVFSGVYCVNADFLELLPTGEKVSVIPAFLELARQGRLGAVVLDEGVWLDLGDRDSYLKAHRELDLGERIHESAQVADSAVVERSCVGPGAVIGAGAVVKDSVVWAGGKVAEGASLTHCVVCSGEEVSGQHEGGDL